MTASRKFYELPYPKRLEETAARAGLTPLIHQPFPARPG